MERLTQKSINYCAEICRAQDCETYHGVRNDVCGDAAIYNRLAAYEDTGLSPEDIKSFVSTADNIVKLDINKLYPDAEITMYGKPLSHWKELSKAEKEDRLIVLPCKFGAEVFHVGYSDEKKRMAVFPTIFRPWQIPNMGNIFLTRAEAEKAMKVSG